ncbi:hypothetical protein FGO68_gene310 [Halteria grandinella]|uniref:Uncharacterized protein n=1 Tax=Halteria grandinella TaxID=5974 RepID=A0A8J8NYK2_HALGN|nr:hypothetical protein FGO68_gene310 [Halteria grandinella]
MLQNLWSYTQLIQGVYTDRAAAVFILVTSISVWALQQIQAIGMCGAHTQAGELCLLSCLLRQSISTVGCLNPRYEKPSDEVLKQLVLRDKSQVSMNQQ